MTYAEALDFLFTLPRFGHVGAAAYKPGLDRMQRLMQAFGNPHTSFPGIHIAGTNGKGSTASMVAAIGTASGRKVGLHTSPHLLDFAERMRIDGKNADHEWIALAVENHKEHIHAVEASFFEASVALSFLHFAEMEVGAAVVEVGMGGRLDATNILMPAVCAVTHIGLDHQEQLGESIAAIAGEKAGIAKDDVPFLSAVHQPEAIESMQQEVERRGGCFEDVTQTVAFAESSDGVQFRSQESVYPILELGLQGAHQRSNAALAIRIAELAWPGISEESVRMGLARTRELSGIRGRFEVVRTSPHIVVDVAHNSDGWNAAFSQLQQLDYRRLFVLLGVMADKDLGSLLDLLKSFKATVLPVALPSERTLKVEVLRSILVNKDIDCLEVQLVQQGVRKFMQEAQMNDLLLVTGSHLTAEAGLNAIRNETRM